MRAFNLLPAYKTLETEANELNREIEEANNANLFDQDLLRQLREALSEEGQSDLSDVSKLYAETGIVLSDLVRKRFEDVERFHRQVTENRKAHLGGEISAAELRIGDRSKKVVIWDQRRSQIMKALLAGGALEHYAKLNDKATRAMAEAEGLRQRLAAAEQLESTKAEIGVRRASLAMALQQDIHERREITRDAILTFESLSQKLYDRPDILKIDHSASGIKFDASIQSQRSKGVNNMQIFCFDLMLTEISLKKGRGPRFLIHDSHLFDGVDERQVAKALQLGAERAEACGFQYIVTMNSDALPQKGFTDGFDITQSILEPRLTDDDLGGLFG